MDTFGTTNNCIIFPNKLLIIQILEITLTLAEFLMEAATSEAKRSSSASTPPRDRPRRLISDFAAASRLSAISINKQE